MFSDDEKQKLFSDIEAIRDEQREQNHRLAELEEALYGSERKKEVGMKSQLDEVYGTVDGWKKQFKGGRLVVVGLFLLITSGIGTFVVNLISGG